jgi:hypothetical protein
MVRSPRSITDYDQIFDPVRAARTRKSGHQNGDPDKAAKVVMDLIEMKAPPVHLVLGSHALGLIVPVLEQRLANIHANAGLSISTDFTPVAKG